MKVALIDCEMLEKGRGNYPNLVLMKLSAHYKGSAELILNYDKINPYSLFSEKYDKYYIAKIFSTTIIPEWLLQLPNIEIGGSGFVYDKKTNELPYDIEHLKPDYNLYNGFVEMVKNQGKKLNKYKYYYDYSIGHLTRGCFRKCSFCINKHYDRVEKHAELIEWIDENKPKITLLDSNILAYKKWYDVFEELAKSGKKFKFEEGLDMRLMTNDKAKVVAKAKTDGAIYFSFDFIKDKNQIIKGLDNFRSNTRKTGVTYTFCRFDANNKYDDEFFINDLLSVFQRIAILIDYKCLPFIMLFEKFKSYGKFDEVYKLLSSWCNGFALFGCMTFKEFLEHKGIYKEARKLLINIPDIDKYINIKYRDNCDRYKELTSKF